MKKPALIAGLTIAALIGLGFGGSLLMRYLREAPYRAASDRLESVLAESRRLGMPFTYEELSPPIPDEENAAVVILPIAARIADRADAWNALGSGPEVEGSALANAKYRESIPDLDQLVRALDRPRWRVHREKFSLSTQMPEFANLRTVARLLDFRAQEAARAGDVETALRMLRAGRNLARFVAQDHLVIALLVASVIDARMCATAEKIAADWKDEPMLLARLEDCVAETTLTFDPRAIICSEFYAAKDVAVNLNAYGGFRAIHDFAGGHDVEINMDRWRGTGLPDTPRDRAYLTKAAEFFNSILTDMGPPPGVNPGWAKRADSLAATIIKTPDPSEVLLSIMLITFEPLEASCLQRAVHPQLVLALIQALREPGTTPTLPDDLFAPGQKVKFRRQGETITIWSVGPDGKDDGGERGNGKDDFAVRYPPRTATKLSPSIS